MPARKKPAPRKRKPAPQPPPPPMTIEEQIDQLEVTCQVQHGDFTLSTAVKMFAAPETLAKLADVAEQTGTRHVHMQPVPDVVPGAHVVYPDVDDSDGGGSRKRLSRKGRIGFS